MVMSHHVWVHNLRLHSLYGIIIPLRGEGLTAPATPPAAARMYRPDPALAALPVALSCVLDEGLRGSLEHSLTGAATVRPADDVRALVREAALVEMGAVVYAATGRESATDRAQLESIHRRFPHLPLLVVPARGVALESARGLGSSAAAAVATPAALHPPAPTLDALLREAVERSAAGRLLALLDQVRPDVGPSVRRFIAHTATVPREVSSVRAVARRLGLSLRTLENHLRRDRLPVARELFWAIMVVRGTVLLQDPASSMQRLVALLPFPDSAAVSARFRRYAGVTPSRLRQADAVPRLVTRFAALLAGERSAELGASRDS